MRHRPAFSLMLVLAGCSVGEANPSVRGDPPIVIAETFVTDREPGKPSVDSPALWVGRDGTTWLVVTAKRGNQLYVHDAATGSPIKRVGRTGTALGEFRRPNGVLTLGDLVLVVERDNKRVQVLRAPTFAPIGAIGIGTLSRPYGITALTRAPNDFEIFVTDQYRGPFGGIPSDRKLGQRVRHYRVIVSGERLTTTYLGAFGDTAGPGRLLRVESLAVDPDARVLLIADEASKDVKVYRTDGSFTGRVLWGDLIRHEPEGIALYACGADAGYWVVTDQHPDENRFLVFDRRSFDLKGVFTGATVRKTDGIALLQRPVGAMKQGALYAVHDDRAVGAISWSDIATRLRLRADCG